MRPARLVLEGFTAFRDRTEVDFAGADLFAFTGATGSGKSSLIDAIVFTLFGCIPRYDDRRLVAPAISQGRNEAKTRLEFTVAGESYTAVRVVRRTKAGASTKEARLERADGEVLAGNEKEVTAAVEELLGLGYDHFVKCVVLPQGQFARFLHDKPEKRQELLVELLDLGLYERMAQLARRRERDAQAKGEVIAGRLADLADATPEAREATESRLTALQQLLDHIDRQLPALAQLEQQVDAAKRQADESRQQLALLARTVIPEGVGVLADQLTTARARAGECRAGEAAAEAATLAAEARVTELPSRNRLETWRQAHEQQAAHIQQQAKGQGVLVEREQEEAVARAALDEAEKALGEAQAALVEVEARHRAHAVVGDLQAGHPCPVCQQTVTALPRIAPVADLDAARQRRRDAEATVERQRRAYLEAERERLRVADKLTSISSQLEELHMLLVEAPEPDVIGERLRELSEAEQSVEEARAAERVVRKARVAAEADVAALRRDEVDARRAFDEARDAVAALGPPPRAGDDLATDWQALAEWALAQVGRQRQAQADAAQKAVELEARRSALVESLHDAAVALDLSSSRGKSPSALRDLAVDHVARASADLAQLDKLLHEAAEARERLEALNRERQVAATLARSLGANGFEKWVLDEALGLLVVGATEVLLDLSAGQYSLTLDERSSNFAVVDHRNADEVRSARTLSGGETFLASLALALALADQLALLAAKGAARLESIFLDEGFGTLDPDTLDTVATTIEDLGARGRMVGLISHVAELGERVPVRFEVVKGPHTATVERVDA